MRKLSVWAKHNPRKARIIIIVSHILLIGLAWFAGSELSFISKKPPEFIVYLFVLMFFIAAIAYPFKKNKSEREKGSFYIKQKTCDFSLAASLFGMVLCLSANDKNVLPFYTSSQASVVSISVKKENPTAAEILASLKYRDKSTLTRSEKRILKQEFNKQLKKYTIAKLSGNKEAAGNAGLIILSIIVALGLLYLVAALACSLSCNGSDAAAAAVLVLGIAGIVIGFIAVIRAIKRGPRNKKVTEKVGS